MVSLFRVGRIGFASLPPCTWDAAGAKLPGDWTRADTTGATDWMPGEDEGTHPIHLYDESEGPIGAINGFTPGVTYHVEITVESGTPSNVALRSIHNTAPVTLTEGPGPIIRGTFTWDPTWSDWRNSARIVTTGEASGTVRFWVCGPPWPTPPA